MTPCGGFTLIELILVMALLTIAISVAAPALSRFFRGRSLDSEARRLLALTRYGQSRAASEGLPMELWVDTRQRSFGLEAEPSYEIAEPNAEDSKKVDYTLDADMQIEVIENGLVPNAGLASPMATSLRRTPVVAAPIRSSHPGLPRIRFLPDGSFSEDSPMGLRLIGRDGDSLLLAQSRNRLTYEIRTGNN